MTHTYHTQRIATAAQLAKGQATWALEDETGTIYQVFSDKAACDHAVFLAQHNDNGGNGLPLVFPTEHLSEYAPRCQRF